MPVAQDGFLYTYLSYEAGGISNSAAASSPASSSLAVNSGLPANGPIANNGTPVYFDDFTVEQLSYIVAVNDLYPFGASHDQERSVELNNKYRYQGKELVADLGLLLYDFHARQYDPILGRFVSIDPMAGAYAGMSPYAGMANNPMSVIDPNGQEPITLAALLITAAISGGLNLGINAAQGNVDNFWDGAMYFGIGAAAGAAGGIAGQAVAGAVGTVGFAGGALTGAAGGLAGGFIGGAGNAWVNGATFGQGLKAGAIGGGIGVATGGLIGGVSGGITAVKHGGNFWSGKGATFDALSFQGDFSGDPIEYSNQSAKQFSDEHFSKNIEGLNDLYADGRVPSGYSTEGGAVFNSKGTEVLGTTKYLGTGKGSDVYLYSKAFVSAERLYLTMGHEYIHVAHLNAGLFNSSHGEHSALKWTADQARAFGILPYNKTWANELLKPKYYNAAYDYKKFAINPIINALW